MRRSLIILAVGILFFSCNKEKNYATVDFHFQATLHGNNFALTDEVIDSQNRAVKIELLKFYIGNITFVDKKGKEELASEIEIVDIDVNGHGHFSVKVPHGSYTSVKFGIGVPSELNAMNPSDFTTTDHPLASSQGTFWGMAAAYRFLMVDGRYDIEQDQVYDGTYSYHSGYDSSYRNVSFEENFEFDKQGNYTINLILEMDEILEGPGGNLDIINESNYHGDTADQHLSEMISDNFAAAISLAP